MIWAQMGFIMVTSAFRKGDFPAPEMLPNTDPEVVAIDVNDRVRRAVDPTAVVGTASACPGR
ncbi:hypothetical protein ATK17_0828 [Branchiibius hedensis]|uniref:Uncharacterized protein n=1 Tax=Branchiibius hedensis TaxID=672460 RepID=A0A2Y8ZNZ7_9MICO|nr:hypothetical protein ATK17_0828 [Branchiibius hedensis]SSA33544.1 hypothetical protein SAMN04489750_0828 [Branchiibius hedensis]